MRKQTIRPAWWKLYLIVGVGLGLMVLDAIAPLSALGHRLTECGLLVLIYGLIWLWVRASRLGLLEVSGAGVRQQSPSQRHFVAYTVQTPPPQTEAGGNGEGHRGLGEAPQYSPQQVERGQN